MRSNSPQSESIRHIESGRVRTSQVQNMVDVCRYVATLTKQGELQHAGHILDQLIRKYPQRSHHIRLTVAAMVAEEATT